jgi:hypothetical protein
VLRRAGAALERHDDVGCAALRGQQQHPRRQFGEQAAG